MHISDIIKEERQRLDEVVFLGIPLATIFSAISLGFTALSLYDINNLLKKNDYDINNMSSDDYGELFIDLILLLVPGASKLARPTIVKLMPKSVKKMGAKFIANKTAPLFAKLNADINAARVVRNAVPITPVNRAATLAAYKASKQLAIKQFKTAAAAVYAKSIIRPLQLAFSGLAITGLTIEYYSLFMDLDDQYKKYKAGDRTTSRYKDMSPADVDAAHDAVFQKYKSEYAAGVAVAVAAAPIASILKTFT